MGANWHSHQWRSPGEGMGGGTPLAQPEGMGENCKLPIGAWGGAPEAIGVEKLCKKNGLQEKVTTAVDS